MPWQTTWLIDVQIDLGIAAIIKRGRHGIVVECKFQHHAVELGRCHARVHMGRYQIEGLGAKPSGPAHSLKALRAMQLDLSGIGKRCNGSVNIGHKLSL